MFWMCIIVYIFTMHILCIFWNINRRRVNGCNELVMRNNGISNFFHNILTSIFYIKLENQMNCANKYLIIYIVWSVYPFIERMDYLNTLMDYMATQCFHFAYLKLRFIIRFITLFSPKWFNSSYYLLTLNFVQL